MRAPGPSVAPWWVALLVAVLASVVAPSSARADDAVVRAVLFFSPTCPHCHQVMTVDLPPIQDRYGDRFQLALVDVSSEAGSALYRAAVSAFEVPEERLGVPTLVLGDTVLVGSLEIPEQLPGLIDDGLAQGGTDWPAIPGFLEALATASTAPTGAPEGGSSAASGASPIPGSASASASAGPGPSAAPPLVGGGSAGGGLAERYGRDPVGNSLAVVTLVGLLLVLVRAIVRGIAATSGRTLPGGRPAAGSRLHGRASGLIVAAALVGLASAVYLAFVELTSSTAVCGPVGDCNAVHSSEYATLAGIPIGVLGVLGYLAILACWLVGRLAPEHAATAHLALFLLALGGTAFSVYLTLLEPFVIGATCGWCLLSAVMMASILFLATPPPVAIGGSARSAGGMASGAGS